VVTVGRDRDARWLTAWLTVLAVDVARLPGVPGPARARVATVARAEPAHGSRARYGHRSLACRCDACTEANTAYQREYRAKVARAQAWRPRTWRQLELPGA